MLVIVLRHAERGDRSNPERTSSKEFDAPVSYNAHEQIDLTAKYISEIINRFSQGKQRRVLKIVSSPFLRCLMTAERLATQLKVQVPIETEGKLGEYLRTEWFREYPMDQLVVCDPAQSQQYLDHPVKYIPEKTAFPQNYGMFQKRARSAFERLLSSGKEDQCLIVVTHGFVVRQFCFEYPTLVYDEQIDYCAFQAELVSPGSLERRTVKHLRAKPHLQMKLTEARDSKEARSPDPPFHNVPEILTRVRSKVASASKLFKSISSDKLRLELEHAMLSITNYLSLLEDEATVIVRKNSELEARACEGERLYRDYLEKCAGQQKDLQRDLSVMQARCGKLVKQNEYLTFVNRGLKNQLDEKRKYIAGYRDSHCREVKRMMKTIEQEARAGADKVFDRINQVVEMCDRELQHSPNTEGEEPAERAPDLDFRELREPKQKPESHMSATLKKRSNSACQGTTARKKNIESKLAKIVFEQAKLAERNDRYLQTYLS